jgi:hypothetical protein
MKTKLLFSCLLIAGTVGPVFAQDTPDPAMTAKIRAEGINHLQVMEITFHLIDPSCLRLAGSPSLKCAQYSEKMISHKELLKPQTAG